MVAPGRASAGSPAHWRNPFGAWTPRFHARDEDPNASPRASEAADGAPPKLVMEGGAYLWDDSPWSSADRIASLVDGDPGRWRRVWLEVVVDEGIPANFSREDAPPPRGTDSSRDAATPRRRRRGGDDASSRLPPLGSYRCVVTTSATGPLALALPSRHELAAWTDALEFARLGFADEPGDDDGDVRSRRGLLDRVLHSPFARYQLRRFLEDEFALELLDFWDAVENVRRLAAAGSGARKSAAASVYGRYVEKNAPRQVNISASLRELTRREVEGWSAEAASKLRAARGDGGDDGEAARDPAVPRTLRSPKGSHHCVVTERQYRKLEWILGASEAAVALSTGANGRRLNKLEQLLGGRETALAVESGDLSSNAPAPRRSTRDRYRFLKRQFTRTFASATSASSPPVAMPRSASSLSDDDTGVVSSPLARSASSTASGASPPRRSSVGLCRSMLVGEARPRSRSASSTPRTRSRSRTATPFDAAQVEIFSCLENDVFGRFLATERGDFAERVVAAIGAADGVLHKGKLRRAHPGALVGPHRSAYFVLGLRSLVWYRCEGDALRPGAAPTNEICLSRILAADAFEPSDDDGLADDDAAAAFVLRVAVPSREREDAHDAEGFAGGDAGDGDGDAPPRRVEWKRADVVFVAAARPRRLGRPRAAPRRPRALHAGPAHEDAAAALEALESAAPEDGDLFAPRRSDASPEVLADLEAFSDDESDFASDDESVPVASRRVRFFEEPP
ncbi:hypothetical protein JL720_4943 [Aureococcus anophagefferens]|nr:hypothetical protein JL720_4943 [Aureococcus anophagefferens]